MVSGTALCFTRPVSSESVLPVVEKIIQRLVQIVKYNVFHHFAWDTSKWAIITCCQLISAFVHQGDIRKLPLDSNFPELIEAWKICFRHTVDIMTSTSKSGLQIPSGPRDFNLINYLSI